MYNKLDTIRSYYESNMEKDLPDHSILGWESEEAQILRFDALASYVSMERKKVLDVGCGLGNLAEYLERKGVQAEYTGVDILHSMITRAKQKNLKARFLHCDIFKENPFKEEKFDIVYSSGIFNLNLKNNMEFLCQAINSFLKLSDEIVAFNLLSNGSLDKEDKYYYYDLWEVRSLIENTYAKDIKTLKFVDGYLHNDFTVICSKRELFLEG